MFLAEELSIPKISRLLFCSLMLQIDWIPSSGNVPRAMPETMACHAMPETMHFPIKSDFNLSTNTYLGSIADTTEFSGWLSSSEKRALPRAQILVGLMRTLSNHMSVWLLPNKGQFQLVCTRSRLPKVEKYITPSGCSTKNCHVT